MTIERQRKIISTHQKLPDPSASGQQIYDMTCINPMMNPVKLVAGRTVGSKARFLSQPKTTQEKLIKKHGPRIRSNITSEMQPRDGTTQVDGGDRTSKSGPQSQLKSIEANAKRHNKEKKDNKEKKTS